MKHLTDEEFDAIINKNEMVKYAVSELEQIPYLKRLRLYIV